MVGLKANVLRRASVSFSIRPTELTNDRCDRRRAFLFESQQNNFSVEVLQIEV